MTIHLSWSTTNATKTAISIDPQGGDPRTQLYLTDENPDGGADVPFGCSPPNDNGTGSKYHEYVLIAYRSGFTVTRSIQVYVLTTP